MRVLVHLRRIEVVFAVLGVLGVRWSAWPVLLLSLRGWAPPPSRPFLTQESQRGVCRRDPTRWEPVSTMDLFSFVGISLASRLVVFDPRDEIQTNEQMMTRCFPWHPRLWFVIYTWKRFPNPTDNPSQQKINTLTSHQCKSDALERDKEFTCKPFWHLALSHEFQLMIERAEALSAGEPPSTPGVGPARPATRCKALLTGPLCFIRRDQTNGSKELP